MSQSRESAEATFAEAFEASLNFKTPEQGELLRGTIVSISGDDAFVSYGGPSEAVMAAAELDGLDIGESVEGTVIKTAPDIRISGHRGPSVVPQTLPLGPVKQSSTCTSSQPIS